MTPHQATVCCSDSLLWVAAYNNHAPCKRVLAKACAYKNSFGDANVHSSWDDSAVSM